MHCKHLPWIAHGAFWLNVHISDSKARIEKKKKLLAIKLQSVKKNISDVNLQFALGLGNSKLQIVTNL